MKREQSAYPSLEILSTHLKNKAQTKVLLNELQSYIAQGEIKSSIAVKIVTTIFQI